MMVATDNTVCFLSSLFTNSMVNSVAIIKKWKNPFRPIYCRPFGLSSKKTKNKWVCVVIPTMVNTQVKISVLIADSTEGVRDIEMNVMAFIRDFREIMDGLGNGDQYNIKTARVQGTTKVC